MTFPSWILVTSSAPGYFAIPGALCILTGVLTDPVAHGGSAKEGSCSRAEEGGIRSRSPGRRSDRCSPPGSTTHASTLSAFSLRREISTLLSGGSRIHRSPTLHSLTLSLLVLHQTGSLCFYLRLVAFRQRRPGKDSRAGSTRGCSISELRSAVFPGRQRFQILLRFERNECKLRHGIIFKGTRSVRNSLWFPRRCWRIHCVDSNVGKPFVF